MKYISVVGAKENNLKSINIDIPKGKLVVITGLSGSGKSSLAFDTIYAEGQRRYFESIDSYARQFLAINDKPDVESIDGLSPAIAINQKTVSKNPRSTVATATEIYDYMRVLFARIGTPYSPETGLPIDKQTSSQIVETIMKLDNISVAILSPLVRGQKGEHKKELVRYLKSGYESVRIDSKYYSLSNLPDINKNVKHNIELVLDELTISDCERDRVVESVEKSLEISGGWVYLHITSDNYKTDNGNMLYFSKKFACPLSDFSLTEIEPRIFSFNSPYGACKICNGLGKDMIFEKEKIIPDTSLSISEGAIAPWRIKGSSGHYHKFYSNILNSLAKHYGFSLDEPFEMLDSTIQDIIMYGSEDIIDFYHQNSYGFSKVQDVFKGVLSMLEDKMKNSVKTGGSFEELAKYQTQVNCKHCKGYRLKKESLCVKIAALNIGEVCDLSICDALSWFQNLGSVLNTMQREIAKLLLKEIEKRLQFLINVGLGYLTLSRNASTLSGGEGQRIRLASQIGSSLTGVLYVLDEPSIGLHQSDNDKLIASLKELRDIGNSIIVVEHDEDTMRESDYLIDIGPYAGNDGGRVVAQGTPNEVMKNTNSITGAYLSGHLNIPIPEKRRIFNPNKVINIKGVTTNNLKNVDVEIPVGNFISVTGVSGSGKSSLILQTLYGAILGNLHNSKNDFGLYKSISGLEHIDKVIEIDQQPIGRTPRSNPATYTGVFTHIRDWYSNLKESKIRGYLPGRFSFNVKGGRCDACEGDGLIKIEMHFLSDVYVKCDRCNGQRYNKETLEVTYKNKSISDVLNMSVDEALDFFKKIPIIQDRLNCLHEVGLGYIKIGQSATTLSGGEAQRIKLAKELSKKSTGTTLYIFDEPTTGLHSHDIKKLLEVLHELVDRGNTLIVVEHNLDVIKTSDYIIDIGPNGGVNGGEIIAKGTPEEIVKVEKSLTGKYLKSKL